MNVLGRYRFHRDGFGHTPGNLRVQFRTVRSSEGLAADHIVAVGLERGRYGFPSAIADDPVLDLAMPTPESFPHAEERLPNYDQQIEGEFAAWVIDAQAPV